METASSKGPQFYLKKVILIANCYLVMQFLEAERCWIYSEKSKNLDSKNDVLADRKFPTSLKGIHNPSKQLLSISDCNCCVEKAIYRDRDFPLVDFVDVRLLRNRNVFQRR